MSKSPPPKRVGGIRLPQRGTFYSILTSTALVIGATVAAASGFTAQITNDFDTNKATVETGIDSTIGAFDDGEMNILVLGSDARENEDPENQRSDTMMLVHIPESRTEMYVMSIMRDLWVDIPDVGTAKVNSAQSYGGYPKTIQTVESLTGADIDHMVIIDFDGFSELTTALGGVEVNNDIAFSAGQVHPTYYPQGEIRLQGTDALRFVRERKAFIDGDYQRVANQQKFLTAVASGILNSSTLTDPAKIANMVSAITPFLTVDESLDAETLVSYGMSMSGMRASNITSFTVPNDGTGTTHGGASVVWPDENGLQEMREAMDNNTMAEFVAKLEAKLDAEKQGVPADEPHETETLENESALPEADTLL